MVEIVGGVVTHAKPLHHPPRWLVDDRRERDDLIELERVEAVGDCRAGGLGRVAVAPVGARQSPADLDRRGEVRPKAGLVEADEANERRDADDLDCPQAPAALGECRAREGGERIAVAPRHRRGEVPHRVRIPVQGGERLEIVIAPLPE